MFEYIHKMCYYCASSSISSDTRYTAQVMRMHQFQEDFKNPQERVLSVCVCVFFLS